MKVRKHFRTDVSIIDYIFCDISSNPIIDKDTYFKYCVSNRLDMLNKQYNSKLDKLLSFVILRWDYNDLPVASISKIIYSLSRVTNTLSKGLLYIIENK